MGIDLFVDEVPVPLTVPTPSTVIEELNRGGESIDEDLPNHFGNAGLENHRIQSRAMNNRKLKFYVQTFFRIDLFIDKMSVFHTDGY